MEEKIHKTEKIKRCFQSWSYLVMILLLAGCESTPPKAPEAVGPVPSSQQLAWHEMEYYAFVHFNMNTFTNKEWGFGDEDPKLFNPSSLDCKQWVRIFKAAGMKGVILTAKHHDGFCLWPSEFTDHSVKNSPWKNGNGDVIQELVDACSEYDLKLGLYLSPWDRNHADYAYPVYLDYFHKQLQELLTNYGDVFEVWFDGANGGDGYYGGANELRKINRESYYQWDKINQFVLKLQPDAIIFSDNGPGTRWIGNERGYAGETCWAMMNPDDVVIGGTGGNKDLTKLLNEGDENGSHWIPGETNVSIRPGWYYHPSEDEKVKSLEQLLDNYYSSVGRGTTWLLNIPVDKRGLVHENDSAALMDLKSMLDKSFSNNLIKNTIVESSNTRENHDYFGAVNVCDDDPNTYWASDEGEVQVSLIVDFREPKKFNRFLIQEFIALGQRVKSFQLEAHINDKWVIISQATTIGYKRILRFPMVKSQKLRLRILDAKASPLISKVGVFAAPELISNPIIKRDKNGAVSIKCPTIDPLIHYTTNGSVPGKTSDKYVGPFDLKEGGIVKAIAILDNNESSEIVTRSYDVCKDKWSVHYADSFHPGFESENAIDDDPGTMWHTNWGDMKTGLPHAIQLDLGEEILLKGFSYTPRNDNSLIGVITKYNFSVSLDGENWERLIVNGEFSNIQNNPVTREVRFESDIQARFISLEALNTVDSSDYCSTNEIGVITK